VEPSAGGTSQKRTRTSARDEQARARVLETLDRWLDELALAGAREIFNEVPAYQAQAATRLQQDVRNHVSEHYRAALASFHESRPTTREDLLFMRKHAAQRVERVSIADFIHAFHVGQGVLWDAAVELAEDDASRRAVLGLVSYLARYFEVATTHAAEVYLEAEQELAATGERLRRDALEELLAGDAPTPGPLLDALRAAGLDHHGDCQVIVARATSPSLDLYTLRGAATVLARTMRRAVQPLTVLRHDEIVIVAPAPTGDADLFATRLGDAQSRLARRDVPLAIGLSTVHRGLAAVRDAYREAAAAAERSLPDPGFVALPAMSTFDYLTMGGDPTVLRLIPGAIERFIAEDRADGGQLIATLEAYVAADLNAKRAAEQLHIHVNTAHYRLAKITERTGVDLHHLPGVIELLIAIRVRGEIPAEPAPAATVDAVTDQHPSPRA
jgi:sugar diacid utilization regulator